MRDPNQKTLLRARCKVFEGSVVLLVGGDFLVGERIRTESEIERVVDEYSDMLFRIGITHLKNRQDAEDIVQRVLLVFLENQPVFQSKDHEKAWLIRVAVNTCRNHLKSAFFRKTIPYDEDRIGSVVYNMEIAERGILKSVLALPDKYRMIIYLFYFEDYTRDYCSRANLKTSPPEAQRSSK